MAAASVNSASLCREKFTQAFRDTVKSIPWS